MLWTLERGQLQPRPCFQRLASMFINAALQARTGVGIPSLWTQPDVETAFVLSGLIILNFVLILILPLRERERGGFEEGSRAPVIKATHRLCRFALFQLKHNTNQRSLQ